MEIKEIQSLGERKVNGKKSNMSKINATEARQYFGKVIQRVYSGDEHLLVEKNGQPVVVILSIKEYEEMRKAAALQNLQELNRSLNRKACETGLTEEKLEKKMEETKIKIFEELYG
jgi:prevent-host-death family protein